jgi:carbonic anhydrase/acetyltransferase-like protein (isoleucine patch superfamily)
MMPSFDLISYCGKTPALHPSVFVASGVRIVGDVTISENSSVWFNCVIRGDVNFVRIGKSTNIQDGAVLHVTAGTASLQIGDFVTIGHSACLHGCVINDYSLIGIGATVLDNAIVEPYALVAAGSVITPGFTVPSYHLVAGVPAKIIRNLNEREIAYFEQSAKNYVQYAGTLREEMRKQAK